MIHDEDPGRNTDVARLAEQMSRDAAVRRSTEPVPAWAACKWLPGCYGARRVHDHWTALDLWYADLHGVLDLPPRDECCLGCPSLIDTLEAA